MTEFDKRKLAERLEGHLRDGATLTSIVEILAGVCDDLSTISEKNLSKPEEVQRSTSWGQCRDLLTALTYELPR